MAYAGSRATAEDAAQETFLKAVRHFDRYVHKGRFRPFFIRLPPIPVWTCGGKRNRRPCRRELVYTEQEFDRAEQEADLARLVERLPEKQRGNRAAPGLPKILRCGKPPMSWGFRCGSVQSRLRAALKYLKEILKEGGETDAK